MHYSSIDCVGTEDTLLQCDLSTDFINSSCMADNALSVVSIQCCKLYYHLFLKL